jgi:hypothetical protein
VTLKAEQLTLLAKQFTGNSQIMGEKELTDLLQVNCHEQGQHVVGSNCFNILGRSDFYF